jgi:hypothetical protein
VSGKRRERAENEESAPQPELHVDAFVLLRFGDRLNRNVVAKTLAVLNRQSNDVIVCSEEPYFAEETVELHKLILLTIL